MTDLHFESAIVLAEKIRNREASSVELLNMYLERVDKYNPDLNAIIVDIREEARRDAEEADKAVAAGDELGPLHGVPMTVKESYDIAGTPSTWGSVDFKDNIADKDALSIARLKKAGAVIFGKTNVPLMLSDFQSYNDVYGTTNNPWDVTRVPGGSSGGSAATLASGMAGIETGSDIGGSIRNPAHFCGVFGHKPTYLMLPPRGHALNGIVAPSDLSVIGPLGRSAQDVETATLVMAGPDEIASRGMQLNLPTFEKNPSDLRVAVWRDDDLAPVDVSVLKKVDAVATALKDAGAQVNFDARPSFASEHHHTVYQSLLQMTMSCRQPAEVYDDAVRRANALADDDHSLEAEQLRNQVGRFRDWVFRNEERTKIRWAWRCFFEDYDVVLAPIMARSAFPHDHRRFGERTITVNGSDQPYFTQVFWAGIAINAYLPSTVIPAGLDDDGLPIGLQIIGPEYGDLTTLGVAKQLESAGFAFQAPPSY